MCFHLYYTPLSSQASQSQVLPTVDLPEAPGSLDCGLQHDIPIPFALLWVPVFPQVASRGSSAPVVYYHPSL